MQLVKHRGNLMVKQAVAPGFAQTLGEVFKRAEAAREMMAPQSAAGVASYLKDQHILEQQRAESWRAVWTPQDTSIDRLDPYTLRVIGRQEITKAINNSVVRETKQLQLMLRLVSDPAGRNDANRRMGFLVATVAEELRRAAGRIGAVRAM